MALARQKTWSFEEVLASADLNTEFDNLVDNSHISDQGERVVMQKNTAPTGWTKDTTTSGLNNTMLRVTTGTVGSRTGGTGGVTDILATNYTSDGTTISTSTMPSHNHNNKVAGTGSNAVWVEVTGSVAGPDSGRETFNTGGGSSHNHTVDLDVDYFDSIVAEKDAN